MWLSMRQTTTVMLIQLPAAQSCKSVDVFNFWQTKKAAGSKWADFQHRQQSILAEPWKASRWT